MDTLEIRSVNESDAPLLKHLATLCPPLDVHTPYTYWVIARFFGNHSFLATYNGEYVGYITSAGNSSELLIWQIGLLESYRKKGCSYKLIEAVFDSLEESTKNVYVSIAKENMDSYSAFHSFCKKKGYTLKSLDTVTIPDMDCKDFLEVETLYQIVR